MARAVGWYRVGHGWWRGYAPSSPVRLSLPPSPAETALDEAARAALFAQALHENSNREMDWLWLETQVTRNVGRRYCLQRALTINPHSDIARRQLLALRVAMAAHATLPVTVR